MTFDLKQNSLWLSPEVLQWPNFSGGGAEPHVSLRSRSYEIWNHAEQRLREASSDLQLVDVITTLKRSVDHRMRVLDGIYSFDSIPIKGKPSELLSLLEFLEIVRPLMFRNLLEIRNAVEHEDAPPPDKKTSQVLLEFVWYFLRSTDRMLQLVSDQIGFHPADSNEGDYWLEVGYGPSKDWNPKLRGFVPRDLVSTQAVDDWIFLASASKETNSEVIERFKARGDAELVDYHLSKGRRLDDIHVEGDIRGSQGSIVSLTKIYFSAA
jgi:hypothetical protein